MKAPRPIKFNLPGGKPAKKARAQRRDLETPIAQAIYEFLTVALLKGSIIHHSPNEIGVKLDDLHRKIVIGKWKSMGMLPGFPDLVCFAATPDESFRAFVVEVKSDTGEMSQEQRDVKRLFENMGIPHCLARSIRDVEEFLAWNWIDTRLNKSGVV